MSVMHTSTREPSGLSALRRDAVANLKRRDALPTMMAALLFFILALAAIYYVSDLCAYLVSVAGGTLATFSLAVILRDALLLVAAIGVLMPLWLAKIRMAGLLLTGHSPQPRDLFYYFTAFRRYRRALCVGAFTLLFFALPISTFAALFSGVRILYVTVLRVHLGGPLAVLLGIFAAFMALSVGVVVWFLSGVFLPFAPLAVGNEQMPMGRCLSLAVSTGRRHITVIFVASLGFLGALALSLLSVGVLYVLWFSHFYSLFYVRLTMALCSGQDDDPATGTCHNKEDGQMKEKFYLTTAIAYASRKPHFGNTYEVIMADAYARYKREQGFDVFFCTGTDEHGQKIENLANEAGISPQKYVDNVAGEIRGIWDKMNSSYDYFIRTTDQSHCTAVQKIFKKFYDQGDIYKGHYEGWYCTPCESFFTETQVVDGKCPDCGRPVEQAREEAYFFKMSNYVERLLAHIDSNPEFIQPESRKKEMVNNFLRVEGGLQDLCVSRTSFKWGIPVTFDERHVTYVWLDALTNYITALGYDPDKSFEEQSEHFKKYWPCDVHIIGKDILRFHTIYWPIFLMALGLPLPKKVFGHPWFNAAEEKKGGEGAEVKMSKSRGNVIYADELAETFGVDGVRYFALSEMPYDQDGRICYTNVLLRYNTDLANNLGNLVSRTHAMTLKYFGGIVPAPAGEEGTDGELKATVADAVVKYKALMDDYHIADAAEVVFNMLRRANKYIDETMPWALAKDESQKARLGTVLYNLLECIRTAAVLLTPFIPTTAEAIFAQIGSEVKGFDSVASFGALVAEKPLGTAYPLFARIDEKVIEEIIKRREEAALAAEKAAAPVEKPEGCALIGIEDFMNVELRTAKVVACERVPKAKKLLKLQLDLGYEQRQVVSGIAKFYEPEALIGKKLIVVANLKPATLCGIESQGMILASGEEQVRVVFLDPETPLGERVR